jgi:hypothetical protein
MRLLRSENQPVRNIFGRALTTGAIIVGAGALASITGVAAGTVVASVGALMMLAGTGFGVYGSAFLRAGANAVNGQGADQEGLREFVGDVIRDGVDRIKLV